MTKRWSRRGLLGGAIGLGAGALFLARGHRSPALVGAQGALLAVACEDFWGSILTQIGGPNVNVTNVIQDPAIDPHDYEPTASDARLFAGARYVVVNGAGYDPWAPKFIAANPVPGRQVLAIADLLGKKDGDNPHFWYSPDYVLRVTDQMAADLQTLDTANAAFYDTQRARFESSALQPYRNAIAAIKQRFAGTPVGASESIFVYLAQALGLNLITPSGFLDAINSGSDPTPQDKATADAQIAQKQIAVYVYNSQNTTPDVDAQRDHAQATGIPIVAITETPDPATQTFQDWQTAQLQALTDALAMATGN